MSVYSGITSLSVLTETVVTGQAIVSSVAVFTTQVSGASNEQSESSNKLNPAL